MRLTLIPLIFLSLLIQFDVLAFSRASRPITVRTEEHLALLKKYDKAQLKELRQYQAELKLNYQNLLGNQKKLKNDWESNEKIERRKFFKENMGGPERRAYIRDFIERRKKMLAEQDQERSNSRIESDLKLKEFNSKQVDERNEFTLALDRGEVPDQKLWPKNQ